MYLSHKVSAIKQCSSISVLEVSTQRDLETTKNSGNGSDKI